MKVEINGKRYKLKPLFFVTAGLALIILFFLSFLAFMAINEGLDSLYLQDLTNI